MRHSTCKFARASMICAAPCIAVTLLEYFVFFVLGQRPETVEYAMLLGFVALCLLPVALASMVLVIFAKQRQGLCLGLSCVYFAGWAALFAFP